MFLGRLAKSSATTDRGAGVGGRARRMARHQSADVLRALTRFVVSGSLPSSTDVSRLSQNARMQAPPITHNGERGPLVLENIEAPVHPNVTRNGGVGPRHRSLSTSRRPVQR